MAKAIIPADGYRGDVFTALKFDASAYRDPRWDVIEGDIVEPGRRFDRLSYYTAVQTGAIRVVRGRAGRPAREIPC